MVIGAIGPSADYSEKMLLEAMAENIPYVDPGGIHLIRKMRNSSMKGTAIVGSGIFPGLSGWMLSSVLKEAFNDDLIEMIIGEEVNIPSGVTIGNVMLPSVKETFEQIWPDAVKKALEILFKQNRTEKMSMAQYQIYVSKLWSEICQKVGYMNIVDYDNFGDIKSIFYDLEKRHLIKKENDGIE